MKDKFAASIKWISHKEGGRKGEPKEGTRDCPLIRIYNAIGYEEWSIDFICPDFNQTDIIHFKFLVKIMGEFRLSL